MEVKVVATAKGPYAVAWKEVESIVGGYHRAQYKFQHSSIHEHEPESSWNPLSKSLPRLKEVTVDWDDMRKKSELATASTMSEFRKRFKNEAPDILRELQIMERTMTVYQEKYKEKLKIVEMRNNESIGASTDALERSANFLAGVRDVCAGTLVLGSTFITGGASLALLGGGSALTGVGKYQDTGSIGAGLIAGGGSVAIGYFSVAGKGLKMANSAKTALLVASGMVETGSGLIAGDSWEKAVADGAASIAFSKMAGAMMDSRSAKSLLKKAPMPVKIKAVGGTRAVGFKTKSLGKEIAKDLVEKAASGGMKKAGGAAVEAATSEASASTGLKYGALAGQADFATSGRAEAAIQDLTPAQNKQAKQKK